jgi:hypothetical protein
MAENLNIIGNWNVIVYTPFGESKAVALIKAVDPFVSGTIEGERGSFDFSNGVVSENILTFSTSVDTPIKAQLSVDVAIGNDKFSGMLMIDEYMKVVIRGIKNVNI